MHSTTARSGTQPISFLPAFVGLHTGVQKCGFCWCKGVVSERTVSQDLRVIRFDPYGRYWASVLGPGLAFQTALPSQCLDEAFEFLSRLLARFAGRSIAGGGLTSPLLRGWALGNNQRARVLGKCQSIILILQSSCSPSFPDAAQMLPCPTTPQPLFPETDHRRWAPPSDGHVSCCVDSIHDRRSDTCGDCQRATSG
jgi:hypothetical protein